MTTSSDEVLDAMYGPRRKLKKVRWSKNAITKDLAEGVLSLICYPMYFPRSYCNRCNSAGVRVFGSYRCRKCGKSWR